MPPLRQIPIRAVLFDAVGTLLMPREPVAATYCRLSRPLGSRLQEAEIAERFAAALAEDREVETSEERERLRWRNIVAKTLPDLDAKCADQVFHQLWDYFARPDAWLLGPDVADGWRQLTAAGLVVGIASNFDSRLEVVRLGHPPLDQAAWCFVSSEIGFRKPSPRFFEKISHRLGLPPEEILLVGDDPVLDYQAALAAGWQAVLVDRAVLVDHSGAPARGLWHWLKDAVGD